MAVDQQLADALTELEQLRATVAQWEAVAEALENVAKARVDTAESRLASLRSLARALVEKLPHCSQRWWKDARGDKTPPDAWTCNALATNVHIGPDGDESYYCDAHFQHEYVPWAAPLRALEAELEGK